MHALHHRPSRLITTALATAGIAVATIAGSDAPLIARAEAAGQMTTVGPGANLQAVLLTLRPGDTLLLKPGTYQTGVISPSAPTSGVRAEKRMSVGTPTAPITVAAADPANRPLILGEVKLWGASYWKLDGLRVQSVDTNREALYMGGGVGWSVMNSEFTGARQTGAYSNVAIANDIYGTGAPREFTFNSNCVHDAAMTTRNNEDQNIYVSFSGTPTSGGVISRNIVFGHPNGNGIKLGNGGAPHALGPWNVKVTSNTVAQGGRQVLLHGNVRNNTVSRNILASSTEPFRTVNKTTAVYLNLVDGRTNRFDNNYAASTSMFSFGPNGIIGADNAVRADPKFSGLGCSGFRPTNPGAASYGRYSPAS